MHSTYPWRSLSQSQFKCMSMMANNLKAMQSVCAYALPRLFALVDLRTHTLKKRTQTQTHHIFERWLLWLLRFDVRDAHQTLTPIKMLVVHAYVTFNSDYRHWSQAICTHTQTHTNNPPPKRRLAYVPRNSWRLERAAMCTQSAQCVYLGTRNKYTNFVRAYAQQNCTCTCASIYLQIPHKHKHSKLNTKKPHIIYFDKFCCMYSIRSKYNVRSSKSDDKTALWRRWRSRGCAKKLYTYIIYIYVCMRICKRVV